MNVPVYNPSIFVNSETLFTLSTENTNSESGYTSNGASNSNSSPASSNPHAPLASEPDSNTSGPPTNPHPQALFPISADESLQEREFLDLCAEFYAIFSTVERLEKGYIKDNIPSDQYEKHLLKLMSQFKTVKTAIARQYPDPRAFLTKFNLECPAAEQRLLVEGIPATLSHGNVAQSSSHQTSSSSSKLVAETVQNFIGLMDLLQLKIYTVSSLLPATVKLLHSLNSLSLSNFGGCETLKTWISKLNQISASDAITPNQGQQLHTDLELMYSTFYSKLGTTI